MWVTNRFEDYRAITGGPYDRIVSVGMFEHIRSENYDAYMQSTRDNLTPDGLSLLHCIGSNNEHSSKKIGLQNIFSLTLRYQEALMS